MPSIFTASTRIFSGALVYVAKDATAAAFADLPRMKIRVEGTPDEELGLIRLWEKDRQNR